MVAEKALTGFSALQRAEIAEITALSAWCRAQTARFSALQRAEIAEISTRSYTAFSARSVSVLFNEPKLLKFVCRCFAQIAVSGFSALQRAEIAEIIPSSFAL